MADLKSQPHRPERNCTRDPFRSAALCLSAILLTLSACSPKESAKTSDPVSNSVSAIEKGGLTDSVGGAAKEGAVLQPTTPTNPAAASTPAPASAVVSGGSITITSQSEDPTERLIKMHETGGSLISMRRFEEAIGVFRKVLELKPDDEEAHFNLGFCFARLAQQEPALHHYREAIRILPEYAEAHNNLGNLLVRQGKLEEAMKHFRDAIHNAPENASAHNNLGTTLVRSGKIKDSIPSFEEAVRLNTNYVEAYFNLGKAYQNQGRNADAITQFQKSISLDPNFELGRKALERSQKLP